ncbi:hypothetical protein J1N35_023972 [Gossypium stocksii]|uniref:Retrotransposon Copia-like N-terminal domain-containing protein n=1 Tax=Gossypium stocksii TaxID=47602 RepID=A0A9D3VK46_9ROSI|nr:hypothetical protein J1N35_023972 [Gossypium stocksii]
MVTPSGSTVHFNHPLHLHPSDTPGAQLVSHQLLRSENYTIWSQSYANSIVGEEKIGFCGCKELSAGVVFASSAAMVWTDLSEHFNKVDGQYAISHLPYHIRSFAANISAVPEPQTYQEAILQCYDKYLKAAFKEAATKAGHPE